MSVPPKTMYLDLTDKSARRLFQLGIAGPLLILNLLRFRGSGSCPDSGDPECRAAQA